MILLLIVWQATAFRIEALLHPPLGSWSTAQHTSKIMIFQAALKADKIELLVTTRHETKLIKYIIYILLQRKCFFHQVPRFGGNATQFIEPLTRATCLNIPVDKGEIEGTVRKMYFGANKSDDNVKNETIVLCKTLTGPLLTPAAMPVTNILWQFYSNFSSFNCIDMVSAGPSCLKCTRTMQNHEELLEIFKLSTTDPPKAS